MITPATPADAAQITALWNEVISETTVTFTSAPKTQSSIEDLMKAQPVFVARDAVDCIGFATYSQFRAGDGYRLTQEHAIYLTHKARGRGLGRGLMQAVEDHARAAGSHSLIAGISAENTQGIAFHGTMGFVQVGYVPEVGHKFGRFLDLVLMQKRL